MVADGGVQGPACWSQVKAPGGLRALGSVHAAVPQRPGHPRDPPQRAGHQMVRPRLTNLSCSMTMMQWGASPAPSHAP